MFPEQYVKGKCIIIHCKNDLKRLEFFYKESYKKMKEIKNKDIGYRIMELRLDRGYSRERLAERAGISSKFLFEIERNEKGFSANTLINLAEALDVSADYIMTGHGSTKFDEGIAEALEKFEPSILEKVEDLLKLAYEIAHCN